MIEILEFAFRDFWTWLGCCWFLYMIVCGIAQVRLVVVKQVAVEHAEQRGAGAKETVKVS